MPDLTDRDLAIRVAVEVMDFGPVHTVYAWKDRVKRGFPLTVLYKGPGLGNSDAYVTEAGEQLYCGNPHYVWGIPHYSTSISAAWEVVEKLKAHYMITLIGGPDDEGGCEEWTCRITARGYRSQLDTTWQATAPTAPRAICLAALKVGEGK